MLLRHTVADVDWALHTDCCLPVCQWKYAKWKDCWSSSLNKIIPIMQYRNNPKSRMFKAYDPQELGALGAPTQT